MTDPLDDAERIAALLDGRLDARQREEILARLGTSNVALEAFVDAAGVIHGEGPRAKALPARSLRWRRAGLAIAASIVAIITIVSLARMYPASAPSADPRRFAVSLASESTLPSDWNGAPWATTRGTAEPLTDSARAIRLGAHLTDLILEIRASDARAARSAADIAVLLDAVPGSASVAQIFRQMVDTTRDAHGRDSLLALGAPLAAVIAGREAVDLGAWMEAARIAAAHHNVAFFTSAGSRALMSRLPASIGITWRDFRAPGDWNGLQIQVTTGLAALGS